MPPPAGRGRGRGKGHPGSQKPHQHPLPHPKPAPKQFERVYDWRNGVTVVLKHHLGDNIRVNPDDCSKLDFYGGTGEFARWKVHVHGNGSVIQLESCKTGKFLRMQPNGNGFYVNGIAKELHTYFIVEKQSTPGVAYVKTKETYRDNQRPYLAVKYAGKVQRGLTFFREGSPEAKKLSMSEDKTNISSTTGGGNDEVKTAAKGYGAPKQQPSAPSVDEMGNVKVVEDKFFSELGISLVDQKAIVDLARDRQYDRIEDICSSYPALILDGKLRKGVVATVMGIAIGLARNNQSDGM